jgi:hypothetical protein
MRGFLRIGSWLYGAIALFLSLFILRLNWNLWTISSRNYDNLGADVLPQLNGIKARLEAGEGDRMQSFFPEGYFFSHAVYGYSWVNVGLIDASMRQRAIREVEWTIAQLDSPKGKKAFNFKTQVPNGVFYLGWSNRLLGGLLKLQRSQERTAGNINRFNSQSAQLAKAYQRDFMLEAYPGMSWPGDQTMALSSLLLHDELFGSNYRPIVQRWVQYVGQNLDPKTRLIPHRVGSIAARGSSQVYLLPFLMELDPEFATEQYGKFRREFTVSALGFLPVREYPIGINGEGDVDSGPLIMGFGPTATVTGLLAARAFSDRELFDSSLVIMETLGFPWEWGDRKSYGFSQLVVMDDFLVWGKTWVPWTTVKRSVYGAVGINRWGWIVGSGVGLLLLWYPIVRRRKTHE